MINRLVSDLLFSSRGTSFSNASQIWFFTPLDIVFDQYGSSNKVGANMIYLLYQQWSWFSSTNSLFAVASLISVIWSLYYPQTFSSYPHLVLGRSKHFHIHRVLLLHRPSYVLHQLEKSILFFLMHLWSSLYQCAPCNSERTQDDHRKSRSQHDR